MRWHLFANGKFKVKHMNGNIYKLRGYDNGHRSDPNIRLGDGSWAFKQNCTLIARPISDMTDEEWESMKYAGWYSTNRQELIDTLIHRDWWQWPQGVVNDMVHVGIYPGPQSHLDDGTVIDGSKLEEA